MATVVCQGLQSCLESHLVEPRTLRLKLSSTMSHYSQPLELLALKSSFPESNYTKEQPEKCQYEELSNNQPNNFNENNQTCKNSDMGSGWSFLQALSNISQASKIEKESTYVHPLVKRSKTSLSEKSLKLCTENLGNETGTDIIETSIFSMSSMDSEEEVQKQKEKPKRRQILYARKAKPKNFPPPLTTISGLDSIHVKAHREDGRLVIKAFKNPLKPSSFVAERSHGRLRLILLESSTCGFDSDETTGATVEDNGGENENDPTNEEGQEITKEEEDDAKDLEKEEEEEEEEESREKGEECLDEVVNGNSENVGDEMGMENFERPRKCKEGGEHENKSTLLNWETFCVATS